MLCSHDRRQFLRNALAGGMGMAVAGSLAGLVRAGGLGAKGSAAAGPTRVALMVGDDRADNTFRALAEFRQEIAQAIGSRRVVIKPNNVSTTVQLAATHADCIEGIIELLKSIGKLNGAVIAESAGVGPTWEGFSNFGYTRLAEKHGVKLVDLDRTETTTLFVFDEKLMQPQPVRIARMLLDRNNYIISAAKMKTHDRVVATLSLKNIVFGAPVKDPGFRWGKDRAPGSTTQKPIAHGSGIYGINYNLFLLARQLRPDLAVIDGYDGLEGNGPVGGTAVDHRVCVVSPDWLAADRVAVELMGIDFAKIGYLNYCAQAAMGQANLEKIEILGEPIARHQRQYRLHDNIENQLSWMTPPKEA